MVAPTTRIATLCFLSLRLRPCPPSCLPSPPQISFTIIHHEPNPLHTHVSIVIIIYLILTSIHSIAFQIACNSLLTPIQRSNNNKYLPTLVVASHSDLSEPCLASHTSPRQQTTQWTIQTLPLGRPSTVCPLMIPTATMSTIPPQATIPQQ